VKKVIILDRDGVINHDSDSYIKSRDEWHVIEGAPEAIARLNQAGYICVVATNQSGIGRGLYTMETFMQINRKMHKVMAAANAHIEFVLFCPHTPDDNCDCRKPKAGMLDEAVKRLRVDPETVCFVGDALRDVQAARRAKMLPILVKTGKGEKTISTKHVDLDDVAVYDSLADFVDKLLTIKAAE
jgi:D-glycero-D-manno-heptose 1,7-bisphosphate phosphatase